MSVGMCVKYIAVTLSSLMCSCGSLGSSEGKSAVGVKPIESEQKTVELIASVTPKYGSTYHQGEDFEIGYTLAEGVTVDSVILSIATNRITNIEPSGFKYKIGIEHKVGRIPFRIAAYSGGEKHVRGGEFIVMPLAEPVLYGHRVKKTYPHSTDAYTQGLLWHDGHLYESTGQLGQSTLRKVELSSAKIIDSKKLDDMYFGEGLALLGDKLYQLTWENNKALVYDVNTLRKVADFDYGGEGWGLTTDGKYLYMTDGTEKIHVIDAETFNKVRTLEVYTDRSKVLYINEMEWINGEIWANVYTSDIIIRINPNTGAVTGVIDMNNLLPEADYRVGTDVLNGIAYDKATGRIFVTGKNWPKLFEIEVYKK